LIKQHNGGKHIKTLEHLEKIIITLNYNLTRIAWDYEGKDADIADLQWYVNGYNYYRNNILKLLPYSAFYLKPPTLVNPYPTGLSYFIENQDTVFHGILL
jgi:hypothetical protein